MMVDKKITLALVGNPNAGKTTIFNNITGGRQHVELSWRHRREKGYTKFKNNDFVLVDLPEYL